MVEADNCFSSMKYEKVLEDMGLGLIGDISQESRHYPMEHLKRKEFIHWGDCYGLVSEAVDEGVP